MAKTDVKRILAEGGVIIISILLALAADAWWDTQNDRRDEQELYEDLWADLGQFFQDSKDARDDHLRYAAEITELVEMLEVGKPIPDDPRTDSLVARAFFQYRTYEARLEGVQAALTRSEIITNAALKLALMAIPRQVVEMTEEEAVIGRELRRWAEPLSSQTDVSHFLVIDSYDLQRHVGLPPAPVTGARGTIMVDQAMINGLHERLAFERFVIGGAQGLVWGADDIGWYLADELGRQRSTAERPHPSER